MLRVAVFVSGRGSNLLAILKDFQNNNSNVLVSAVVSNKKDCGAFDIAKDYNIPTYLVSDQPNEGFVTYSELSEAFSKNDINLIVLAGFLKKIPDHFLEIYENKIINIHPALLPSFGGKGMYGMNVHTAVFNSSAQVSGPTVHYVNNKYDEGLIIAQRCVDISSCNSPEEIAAAVLTEEHKILPYVIRKLSEDKVKIKNRRVIIED